MKNEYFCRLCTPLVRQWVAEENDEAIHNSEVVLSQETPCSGCGERLIPGKTALKVALLIPACRT